MPVAPDSAILYGPDGEPQNLPHEPLSEDDLRVLIAYKKFLQKHELREATYCNRCWGHNLEDGTRFQVKTSGLTIEAMLQCRCRLLYGKGGGLAS